MKSTTLAKGDYEVYLRGGDSIYGEIQKRINNFQSGNDSNKEVIIDTLTRIQSGIKNLAQDKDTSIYIKVPDEDFMRLDEETKKILNGINMMAYKDKYSLAKTFFNSEKYSNKLKEWNTYNTNYSSMKDLREKYDKVYGNYNILKNAAQSYSTSNKISEQELKNLLQDKSSEVHNIASSLYATGTNYENKKYIEWRNRNGKKPSGGQLDVFIYSNTRQPSMGYIYAHKPQRDLWLKVLQTVPGGVIITGDPRQSAYNYDSIFVETSKSFADNQVITEPLVVEYKGFYDYVTVLGAKKRIYKFYRYGENEIKANFEIPGQPFYFYSPY